MASFHTEWKNNAFLGVPNRTDGLRKFDPKYFCVNDFNYHCIFFRLFDILRQILFKCKLFSKQHEQNALNVKAK